MNKGIVLVLMIFCSTFLGKAQTATQDRIKSYENLLAQPNPLSKLLFRNIGPSIMSGRITDIAVNPDNTTEFYVAYASGGLWYSNNNGQSFKPVFDHQASLTIGAIAVNWKKNMIWVGTGEVNSSRSSYAGTGLYLSKDSGKTWTHKGLDESHHVGKIILHPNNDNIAWVAVLGHLYTKNAVRGIYKTNDEGESWTHSLFVNDSSGCVDLIVDAKNPDVLYASSWTRVRSAWQFTGSGEGSGIYKSTNGGDTWKKMTEEGSGFPTGKGVGRIGLAAYPKNSNILYAVLDNNFNQETISEEEKEKIKPRDIQQMSTDKFLALEDKKLNTYLKDNEYPSTYTAESVKQDIKDQKYTVKDVADWRLADADASLFDTPVKGAEVYRSEDGGMHWKKTHDKLLEGVFFTYGYYFANISVSASNDKKIWLGGYPIITSEDGGKSFTQIDGDNSHPDYHRIWINPKEDNHILACNDGGLNITYDGGKKWLKANNPAVGQFYAITVDNAKPYNVYGGLQDNGTWYGPSTHEENNAWLQDGQYAYKNIGGGDGMQVQVDSRSDDVYVGYQFGNYYRLNKRTYESENVKPVYLIGEKPLRFNWQTPILLSKHNEDVFYIGSNYVHRSLQKGKNLEKFDQELTTTKHKGNVPYGTVTTLSESPKRFGLLYAGTDDGHIHISKDVGYNWTKISNALPQQKWVTRVVASKHKLERVYVTLNGYRQDDFNPYVFVSDDYGKTWKDISKGLPMEPVNVIREDPNQEDIIYIGSDNGLYVSFNKGADYMAWTSNLPRVAIHDMVIQERENDLVLGTHGRSIYIASLNRIQEYSKVKNDLLYVFNIDTLERAHKLGNKWAVYAKPNEQKVQIDYYCKNSGNAVLKVLNEKGKVVFSSQQEALYGFNNFAYNLEVEENKVAMFKPALKKADDEKYYLPTGKYRIEITQSGKTVKKDLILK